MNSRKIRDLSKTKSPSSTNLTMTRDKLNFRQVARQVMLANMFTRIQNDAKSQTRAKIPAEGGASVPVYTRTHDLFEEKPALKRRGIPQLFPMSEEMKQTIIALGKLDLLPDEGRQDWEDDASSVAKTRQSSKFRDKTRSRIIQPQRFIRNVRSSLNNSKRVIKEDELDCEEKNNGKESDSTEITEGKMNCFSNNNSKTSKCNVFSRRNRTAAHHQHDRSSHFIKRPYSTRYSDLGPRSIKTASRKTSNQEKLPDCFFLEPNISSTQAQRRISPNDRIKKITAWAEERRASRSTDENNKTGEEMVKPRRWKSVEMLASEIEEKCLSWLENRYGIGR